MKSKHTKIALFMGASLMVFGATFASAQEVKTATAQGETVTILGSRIKRINKEGPAPVVTIDAAAIQAGGYASIPEVLKSVTQNTGQTLSQQSYGGGIMTPGAAQVDLRGLGPNHTLVMMNGRRIADFPMPFNGLSNFTDVSSIPISMVKSVEVLSGSASAIYGSDAVSGVVNFNIKDKSDGTEVSLRYGDTELGGGQSYKATISTGFNTDKASLLFGAEYLNKKPIWQYQRDYQDSRDDAPTARRRRADYLFMIYYGGDDFSGIGWVPGGAATCDALKSYAGGSVGYYTDTFRDPYCGSKTSVSIGTITDKRESLNTFTSFKYDLDADTKVFADLALGGSKVKLVTDYTGWNLQNKLGEAHTFYNSHPDSVEEEYWIRNFTVEEAGGIDKFTTSNDATTISFVPGFKKKIGNFDLEAALNITRFYSKIKLPEIVSSRATAFFLGAQLGVDEDGLPIYEADPMKAFTALTPAQYASISEFATTKASSYNDEFTLTLTNPALFNLPAGPVGFAFVTELGNQGYEVNPNANATDFGYYVGYAATSGSGSRSHEAIGTEFKFPILESLDFNLAGRYDSFQFAGNSISKPTINAGLEFKPMNSLLIRAAYGTGFRAPDLHYVYAKKDLFHKSATDYLTCRNLGETDAAICDDDFNDTTLKIREGLATLKPETSTSYNLGFVFQPNRNIFMSVDYFNVDMRNQVEDMSMNEILLTEANCKLGTTFGGASVNPNSAACLDAVSRVNRDADGIITNVYVNPINIAQEKTDGLDIQLTANFPTNYGKWKFSVGHTEVFNHTKKQFEGDAARDLLALGSPTAIPKQKSNASVGFEREKYSLTFSGVRLGKIQNFDSWRFEDPETEYLKATFVYNMNFKYDLTDATELSLTVNNMLNTKPLREPTHTSYPWYNENWYDPTGRAYFVEVKHKF